jgi:DNA (cytosine-5)-methyltransferase 1
MAHGQGGAEIRDDGICPTLTCNHEAPIAVQPMPYQHVTGSLCAADGKGANGQHADDHKFIHVCVTGDITHTLKAEGFDASEDGTWRGQPIVPSGMAVRRLIPVECERLQDFPDGHTNVPYRGKPASDGPRYKAIGNSMAVCCMAWIGNRIDTQLRRLNAANDNKQHADKVAV